MQPHIIIQLILHFLIIILIIILLLAISLTMQSSAMESYLMSGPVKLSILPYLKVAEMLQEVLTTLHQLYLYPYAHNALVFT